MEQFPKLFKGLGKLKDSYEIKLHEGATLFALTTHDVCRFLSC